MEDENKKGSTIVKMQKLRRAVDRLRKMRSTGEPPIRKKSWVSRIMDRLGLGNTREPDAN